MTIHGNGAWLRRGQVALCAALLTALAGFSDTWSPIAPAHAAREGECDVNPFPDNNPGPGSLRALRPIEPPDLGTYVTNKRLAIVLGKALFWDMQVGSDGQTACATCHFAAGADPRSRNQVAPGGASNPDTTFQIGGGPNHQLTTADFPLHRFLDPNDRFSTLLRTSNDVISSQGVKSARFIGATRGAQQDNGVSTPDPVFNVHGANTRRVEPRNTPTVINAAFSRRSFWDGRADAIFNGVNEFGVRDPNARVIRADNPFNPQFVRVRIEPGAMASQAVAPLTSNLEMAFFDRPLRDVGKRLASATPLAKQRVAWDDSVFLGFARSTPLQQNTGLILKYEQLVQASFHPRWWLSTRIVEVQPNGTPVFRDTPPRPLRDNEYTMLEYNFSLFFGLAVQLYEDTLISDQAPIDRYFEGNLNALTPQQLSGLALFTSETADTACSACHSGAEFTNASRRIILGAEGEPGEVIERMLNGECETVIYDQSFYNIAVRPTAEDLGIGNADPWGNPLAISELLTMDPARVPSQELLTISYPNIANPPPQRGERTSTKGAFKVPTLRNVELTAPYFHNGTELTLKDAVQFYNRGGNFREANVQFIDFEIGRIGLSDSQVNDIVAFLRALTDPRVINRSAPFDHPQLLVPNGHQVGPNGAVIRDADGSAKDAVLDIPAVGRSGGAPALRFLNR